MEYLYMPGEQALEKALASIGSENRLLICGTPDEVELLSEQAEICDESPTDIIESAGQVNPIGWLSGKKSEVISDGAEYGFDLEELEGTWRGKIDGGDGITLHRAVRTREPLASVAVAKLSVAAPWHIPAHFRYGNWNDCPAPEVHCALWKHWFERYGAQIVAMSHDTVEAIVERPPETREAAMELAWEQYWYCSDIVDQGVESIANLGGTLLGAKTWFFWWD